jgi:hypothetical protein
METDAVAELGVSEVKKRRKINYGLVDRFLRENPTATFTQFEEAHPKFKLDMSLFYKRRKKLGFSKRDAAESEGETKEKRSRIRVYTSIWVSENVACYNQVKELVSAVNKACSIHLEVEELIKPKRVEVRRLTK